jgi:hypothetical protein
MPPSALSVHPHVAQATCYMHQVQPHAHAIYPTRRSNASAMGASPSAQCCSSASICTSSLSSSLASLHTQAQPGQRCQWCTVIQEGHSRWISPGEAAAILCNPLWLSVL